MCHVHTQFTLTFACYQFYQGGVWWGDLFSQEKYREDMDRPFLDGEKIKDDDHKYAGNPHLTCGKTSFP